MRNVVSALASAAVLALTVGCGAEAPITEADRLPDQGVNAFSLPRGAAPSSAVNTYATAPYQYFGPNRIFFFGGLTLPSPNIYFIWYGPWGSNTAQTILTDWAHYIGNSPYLNTVQSYWDFNNQYLRTDTHYAGSVKLSATRGYNLQQTDIPLIVADVINAGSLPNDPNGAYFVLTYSTIKVQGFCTAMCGFHGFSSIGGQAIKHAFVGNAASCPSTCLPQSPGSPNNNAPADGMVSVAAHELIEMMTDPLGGGGWYDVSGQETADKCAWNFGDRYFAGGGQANVQLGNRHYYIQQNWINASGGYCGMSWGRTSLGGNHLLTTSTGERDWLIANAGWSVQGIAGYVFPYPEAGTVPFYRLVQSNGVHFFTANAAERDTLLAQGYGDEGVAAYLYPTAGGSPSNAAAMFRMVNAIEHAWASSDALRSQYLNTGYLAEGVAGYVFPAAGQPGTVPLYIMWHP